MNADGRRVLLGVLLGAQVTVPLPSEVGRREILRVHLRQTPMVSLEDKQEACERIARVTGGEDASRTHGRHCCAGVCQHNCCVFLGLRAQASRAPSWPTW